MSGETATQDIDGLNVRSEFWRWEVLCTPIRLGHIELHDDSNAEDGDDVGKAGIDIQPFMLLAAEGNEY